MKRRPKITIFHCSFIYTGGGERIAFGQIEGLKKRGYEVTCFAPTVDKLKCYPDIIDQYSIKPLLPQLPSWLPLRHAFLMVSASLLMPFLAWRFRKTDLFIGENQPGVWLAFVASRVLKKPYLSYTCHPNKMVYRRDLSREQIWKNQKDFYFLSFFFEPFKKILAWLDRVSFKGSHRPILTNGYFIGEETSKIYNVDWIGCPSGAPFIKEIGNNDPFKGRIKIGNQVIKKPYLLYVGRHEVWKRIDLAIKAFEIVAREHVDIRLVIRGPFSNHTKTLKKLVKKKKLEGKVIFSKGGANQKELEKLYLNAALYIFPSQKEDFGIVIVEAMGAGVPVVAWRNGGPTDIIVHGKTGYLVKPFSVNDFADKILKILKNPALREKMSRASVLRVKKDFSWQRHLDILEVEIQRALEH
jgi:glycosyltransferase involved in cell wall biosynthesis